MITIQSGKLIIPEEDRFIGFAGDNLHIQKQFFLKDKDSENVIYRLYLTFDDDTVNYFLLDKETSDGSTTLTWLVTQEDIFKSGVVKAQIKAISGDYEIYHTTTDYFIVGQSAEFSEFFANKENSEFLRYESVLNNLLNDINTAHSSLPYIGDDGYWYLFNIETGEYEKTNYCAVINSESIDTAGFVPKTRTVADIDLSDDISVEQLNESLQTYPVILTVGAPTKSTVGYRSQLCVAIIDNVPTLHFCRGDIIDADTGETRYNWQRIFDSQLELQSYVPIARRIAGRTLENDLSNADMWLALDTFPLLYVENEPTEKTYGYKGQMLIADTLHGYKIYYCTASDFRAEAFTWVQIAGAGMMSDSEKQEIADLVVELIPDSSEVEY